MPKMVPSWFKLAEKWTKYAPSWLQVGSSELKFTQVGSKLAQVGPKLAPSSPAHGPKRFRWSPLAFGEGATHNEEWQVSGKYPASIRRVANREHTFVAEARRKCIIFD